MATTVAGPAASRWVVRGAGLLLTAGAVAVHVRFWASAGGLWRDEVNSVAVAGLPSLRQVWQALPYDSFPVLWHLVLRAWSAVGTTDAAYRTLGLTVGLAGLATLWWNARRFTAPAPVLGLLLLGYTPAVTVYGDSVRGHGLGMVLALLTLGFAYDLSRGVTPARVTATAVAAVAGVQVTFYDAPLVLAFCLGGCAAALTRGGRGGRASAVALLAVGAFAALSELPYVWVFRRAAGVARVARVPWSWARLAGAASDAVRPGGVWPAAAGPALWVVTAAGGVVAAVVLERQRHGPRRAIARHAGVAGVVGLAATVAFLRLLSYRMQPWYFLTGMTVVAACLAPLCVTVLSPRGQRWLAAVTVAVAAAALPPVWAAVAVRRTDVDLAAAALDRDARPGDLVLCSPWYFGVTLHRYARGPYAVVGVPPVSLDFQRFDQLLPYMADPRFLSDIEARVTATLRGGRHVWLITNRRTAVGGGPVVAAPHPVWGWSDTYYHAAWASAVNGFVIGHAADLTASELTDGSGRVPDVSGYEDPVLIEAAGWQPVPRPLPAADPEPAGRR